MKRFLLLFMDFSNAKNISEDVEVHPETVEVHPEDVEVHPEVIEVVFSNLVIFLQTSKNSLFQDFWTTKHSNLGFKTT